MNFKKFFKMLDEKIDKVNDYCNRKEVAWVGDLDAKADKAADKTEAWVKEKIPVVTEKVRQGAKVVADKAKAGAVVVKDKTLAGVEVVRSQAAKLGKKEEV